MARSTRRWIAVALAYWALDPVVSSGVAEAREEHASRPVVRLLGLLARWRERERHRRELATMAPRDFGDIAIPPGLIRE
jgi:uncharacterized protein YjiS (DUF1127 family)